MINVGLIGYGYWGPNIARNIYNIEGLNLLVICDTDPNRLNAARNKYTSITTTTDTEELINNKNVNAIFIATPAHTHFQIAKKSILAKKHVFIEKPITTSSQEAKELCQLAKTKNVILMVDHTFLYTGAVEKIREIVSSGDLGEILYLDSVRVNLGLFQEDANVIWDLAPHDLSIFHYILDKKPTHVSAVGAAHLLSHENISYLTLLYEGGTLAHLHINWMSPVKIRKMIIGGSKKMVIYDDVEPSEKIRLYNTSAELNENPHEVLIQYRTGDILIPRIDNSEALKKEILDFKQIIESRSTNRNCGENATDIVKIIEAAEISMRNNSAFIKIYE